MSSDTISVPVTKGKTKHFLSRHGFVSISSESTNNIIDGSLLFKKWIY